MNAFLRSGLVGAALAGLVSVLIAKFQDLISVDGVRWALLGAGSALASLILSWGWTQAFKFFFVDADLDAPEPEDPVTRAAWDLSTRRSRRIVYAVAMGTCLAASLGLGLALLLLNVTHDARVIYAAAWLTGSLALAGASPWLWKVVFLWAIPWLLAQEKKP